jgi:hypothetical protein
MTRLCAPATENGTIWVTGVTAGTYISLLDEGIVPPNTQAVLSHVALAPLLLVCEFGSFSICLNEMYSEVRFSMNRSTLISFGQQYVAFTLLAQLGMLLVVTPWLLALSGMEMAIGHGGRHDKCCTCRGHFQDQNNQEVDDGQVRLFLSTRSASALRALREAYLSFTSKNYILK